MHFPFTRTENMIHSEAGSKILRPLKAFYKNVRYMLSPNLRMEKKDKVFLTFAKTNK